MFFEKSVTVNCQLAFAKDPNYNIYLRMGIRRTLPKTLDWRVSVHQLGADLKMLLGLRGNFRVSSTPDPPNFGATFDGFRTLNSHFAVFTY